MSDRKAMDGLFDLVTRASKPPEETDTDLQAKLQAFTTLGYSKQLNILRQALGHADMAMQRNINALIAETNRLHAQIASVQGLKQALPGNDMVFVQQYGGHMTEDVQFRLQKLKLEIVQRGKLEEDSAALEQKQQGS